MDNKEYRKIPIVECGEAMSPIPQNGMFAFYDPPPYAAAGAPYGGLTPWHLRIGVLNALTKAASLLENAHAGWKILIFDAWRPNTVQAFMVGRDFALNAIRAGWNPENLSPQQRDAVTEKTLRLWAIPSDDPATPPLHSTGAAIDCTLMDEAGREVDMGSPLDENSDRSNPNYFLNSSDEKGRRAHSNRELLHKVMGEAGFRRHPTEWWHFSIGDQLWAWLERKTSGNEITARYGRAQP